MADTLAIGDKHRLVFDVPGESRGKARPRVTKGGQHTYTPDPGGFVERVGEYATKARAETGFVLTAEPVSLQINIVRRMPKGWSGVKKDRMHDEFAPRTPDIVNVAAAICDALQHILYENDNQVVHLVVNQTWGEDHSIQIQIVVSPEA